jgi:hypothetical protein
MEQTSYRQRKAYGGIHANQARWRKDLEREKARPTRPLDETELDKAILRERPDCSVRPAPGSLLAPTVRNLTDREDESCEPSSVVRTS